MPSLRLAGAISIFATAAMVVFLGGYGRQATTGDSGVAIPRNPAAVLAAAASNAGSSPGTSSPGSTSPPGPNTPVLPSPPTSTPAPASRSTVVAPTTAVPTTAAPPTIAATTTTLPGPTTTVPPVTSTVPAATTTVAPTTTAPSANFSPADEAAFLAAINNLRASLGLSGLAVDPGLSTYARNWTAYMVSTGTFAHSDIGALLGPWRTVGENIAYGGNNNSIFQGLSNSPGHYANMTNPSFTHVGIGAVLAPSGLLWTAHVFGG